MISLVDKDEPKCNQTQDSSKTVAERAVALSKEIGFKWESAREAPWCRNATQSSGPAIEKKPLRRVKGRK
jgi:hypothetical protein